jgi:hypothetical protein
MSQKTLQARTEQALVVIVLSTAMLISCFALALFQM